MHRCVLLHLARCAGCRCQTGGCDGGQRAQCLKETCIGIASQLICAQNASLFKMTNGGTCGTQHGWYTERSPVPCSSLSSRRAPGSGNAVGSRLRFRVSGLSSCAVHRVAPGCAAAASECSDSAGATRSVSQRLDDSVATRPSDLHRGTCTTAANPRRAYGVKRSRDAPRAQSHCKIPCARVINK